MNPIEAYPVPFAGVLGISGLVIVVVAAYVFVETWVLNLKGKRLSGFGAFAAAVFLAWAADLAREPKMHRGVDINPFVQAVAQLPALVYVVLLIALILVLARMVADLRAERRAQITPDSVKEALDALPDGVCFSLPDGAPILVNTQLDALAHDALATAPSDVEALWARLAAGELEPGYAVEPEEKGSVLLLAPDNRAWQFARRILEVEGRAVVETIATDVTEEHRLVAQLEERNRRLATVNERLRAYGRELTHLTREEEVLAAKVRVHDSVGRALVALRVYERQEPARRDRDQLLGVWRRVAHLLEAAGSDEAPADNWELLCQAAEAIDVQLDLTGELPSDGEARDLAIMLIHECLNNAVRHAGAHVLQVRCLYEGDEFILRVTNDGMPPAAVCEESGGLANIRAALERAHGILDIQWLPQLLVEARLKVGEMYVQDEGHDC